MKLKKGCAWTGRFQDRKSGLSALRFDRSKLSGQCYGYWGRCVFFLYRSQKGVVAEEAYRDRERCIQ